MARVAHAIRLRDRSRLNVMQRSRNGRVEEHKPGSAEAASGRPKQRAFCIAALEEGDDLAELRELLRTAGVAVVGQIVQHRERPHPNTYLCLLYTSPSPRD